jgi:nucleoside phosphorylase
MKHRQSIALFLNEIDDSTDDSPDIKILSQQINELYLKFYGKFRFGIITALPKEFAALLKAADKPERLYHAFSAVHYYAAEFPGSAGRGSHNAVLASCTTMGNSASAITATALLKDFPYVTDLIMAGIAGGIPDMNNWENDVRVGDVIVSRGKGLVQYDLTKIEEDRVIVRSAAPKPSARLLAAVDELESLRLSSPPPRWEAHIPRCTSTISGGARPLASDDPNANVRLYKDKDDERRRDNLPVIHYGTIASANALVKKTELRDELRRQFGVLGVEMEGSGLADGAWFDGAGYLVVRGVCDYCDKHKNDVWQQYAAGIAMAYVRAIFGALNPS